MLIFSNAFNHKFIGCPISIENAKYSRNALLFNVCFVLGPNVDTIRYEGVVKKLAEYLTSLEVRWCNDGHNYVLYEKGNLSVHYSIANS